TSAIGTGTVPPHFEFEALASFRRESSEQGPVWMERLINGAKELTGAKPRCAAISFGGPVSPDGGIQSVHVPGWENVDLVGAVARAFDLERGLVFVENDANAGALGECRYGAGRGCRDMLYFTVSTGVGGGVI